MRPLHVHTPWRQIDEHLPFLLEQQLQPEFGLLAQDLDQLRPERVASVADTLRRAQLSVTVHAPFMDLNPGAGDPLIAAATRKRLLQTLEAAARLGARLVVIHPGYDDWRYNHSPQLWLEQAVPRFSELAEFASQNDLRLAVENIFEVKPDSLCSLVKQVDHPALGHCFDIGHWQLFGGQFPQADWLAALGERLFHLHLHDNHGTADDHLPLGEGGIDFGPLATHLQQCRPLPSATLEAHSRAHLLRSLHNLPGLFPQLR